MHQLRLFFIALQFFTRLPVPRWVGFEPDWLRHAARYFPAVGMVVGTVTAGVYVLSIRIWPQPVAVLLSTIAGIYLTGAFHEDGFADTCDGLGGGNTPQRVLEIMKDSRMGAYGAIGIGLMLALKFVVLSSLPIYAAAMALLAAHPLSRLASTALIWRLSYAKADGKAKPLAQPMSTLEFCIATVTASLPVVAICVADRLSWQAIVTGSIAMVVATLWLAGIFLRRIGGYTGDCLGALQQVAEVVFYLGLLAVIRH
ncbi:adenosylcobinamide-GDP ribazoletransferase [Sulfuriferula plumbiphila]|nr:adenosylcobinamide-GDP ribazoletransferase [Sulfuriferula plumbiphila]